MTAIVWWFDGVPALWRVVFTVSLAVVVMMFAWTVVLFVRSAGAVRAARRATGDADAFEWVFIVPALDEEVTIRDSVERLLRVEVARRQIVVVDDGSTDATPDVLASIEHPDLRVVRRDPPNARLGKAAALNDAYRRLEVGDADRSEVIVVIVDADGRLAPDAPRHAADHFADPAVGGVQSLVRIYNRDRLLTWLQDVEFGVYGHLFQAGRNDWGTAGMGGNGQFNRLSALDVVADDTGPWRDRLTEDQDLGLRLLAAGWEGRQALGAQVDQQGLHSLRRLLRQRTRWSQGNLQALDLIGATWRSPFPFAARLELLLYQLMPLWQGLVGISLVGAIWLAATGVVPIWGGGPTWHLALIYVLGFGGTVLGALAAHRGQGPGGWIRGFVIGHVYAVYTWIIWPVLTRSTARQITRRSGWAKTAREPIAADDAPA